MSEVLTFPAPLTVRRETVADALAWGVEDMAYRHWREVGVRQGDMPLDIDWQWYFDAEHRGHFIGIAARRGPEVIGYASYLCGPHPKYRSTPHAHNDAIFVDRRHRGVGPRLILRAERILRDYIGGPVRVLYHAKFHVERERGGYERVFRMLGYEPTDVLLDKIVR